MLLHVQYLTSQVARASSVFLLVSFGSILQGQVYEVYRFYALPQQSLLSL